MSDFLPGDLVEYIDDKTRGTVVAVIDKQQLMIEIEDGLEIPVFKNQLINLSQRENTEKITISLKADSDQKKFASRKSSAIYISLYSENNENQINLNLINDTKADVLFTFYESYEQKTDAVCKGELSAFSTRMLTKFDMQKHEKFPLYTLQLLIYEEDTDTIKDPVIFSVQPKGKMLLQDKKQIPLLGKEGYLFSVYPGEQATFKKPDLIAKQKSVENREIIEVDKPPEVIDLHIDKISDNHRVMSRNEIFDFQFNHFVSSLEKAIAFEYEKIIFIHGIGVNTLKNKIIAYLKNNQQIQYFKEADVRKYGFGATEVRLK